MRVFAAVVNLARAIPPTRRFMSALAWADNERVRKEGSAAVADACLATGVGVMVQESVGMLYADGGSAWIDEDSPADHFPMGPRSWPAGTALR
jgi:hypothetical protein